MLCAVAIALLVRACGGDRQPPPPTTLSPAQVPAACKVNELASGTAPPPGSLPPTPAYLPPPMWAWYPDPSGFRLTKPEDWTSVPAGQGICFSDPHGGRFLGVGQSQKPDSDLVAYWTGKEQELKAELPGYHRVGIKPTDYYDAGALWEYTFDDGDERMRTLALATISGDRAYLISWTTREADWNNNLHGFSLVRGGFQPAG